MKERTRTSIIKNTLYIYVIKNTWLSGDPQKDIEPFKEKINYLFESNDIEKIIIIADYRNKNGSKVITHEIEVTLDEINNDSIWQKSKGPGYYFNVFKTNRGKQVYAENYV